MSNIGKSAGSSGSTPSSKSDGIEQPGKPSASAPVESIKKFEDALDKKKGQTTSKETEKNKEEGGVLAAFKDIMDKIKPKQPREFKGVADEKRPNSQPVIDEVVRAAIDKSKRQPKAEGEMKITKEEKKTTQETSQEGVLKSQAFGKSDKAQPIQAKSESSDKREGDKDERKEEGPQISSTGAETQQQPVRGPLGQNLTTTATQQTGQSPAVKEMAELASTLLKEMRVLVSTPDSTAGKEIRISNIGSINKNLNNVDLVIKRDGGTLSVEFLTAKNTDATNYLVQNKDGLNAALRNGLSDVKDIRIDITQKAPDSQKDDSQGQSRGRREPEPIEEDEQQS